MPNDEKMRLKVANIKMEAHKIYDYRHKVSTQAEVQCAYNPLNVIDKRPNAGS